MNLLPISAYVICKNEEAYLGNCIESLDGCAEIVIVDSGSSDGTIDLIQSYADRGYPIRLFREPWRGYASQKQFALEQCSQPWCLNLDADERLDDALRASLPDLVTIGDEVAGWKIALRQYLIGYGYTPAHVHERHYLRLIRNGRGRYDLQKTVHEAIVPDGQVRPANTGSLLHFRPLPMEEQILKENEYSSLKADQLVANGTRPRRLKLVFNPPLYFLRLYLGKGLWRCGFPGFIEAMTGAVYSFLTESKIYQRCAMKQRAANDDDWA